MHHGVERVFNPDRKNMHWGKRKFRGMNYDNGPAPVARSAAFHAEAQGVWAPWDVAKKSA